jgi:hypothetical protein
LQKGSFLSRNEDSLLNEEEVRLIVFDPEAKEIVLWIPPMTD